MKKLVLLGLILGLSFCLSGMKSFSQEPPPPPDDDDDKELVSENNDSGWNGKKWRDENRKGGKGRGKAMIADLEKYEPGIKDLFNELDKYDVKKNKILRNIFEDMPMIHKMAKDNESLKKMIAKTVKVEVETIILSMKIQKAGKDTSVEQQKKELKAKLAEAFDNKQVLRQMRLDHLKKLIGETEKELKERGENKDTIINQRYDELIKPESKNMRW